MPLHAHLSALGTVAAIGERLDEHVSRAPITENMVEFKAKEILLQDKAAEMEEKTPGSGKGMMLLAEMAKKQYYEYFGQVLSIDLNLDGENFTHVNQPGKWNGSQSYATLGGS